MTDDETQRLHAESEPCRHKSVRLSATGKLTCVDCGKERQWVKVGMDFGFRVVGSDDE